MMTAPENLLIVPDPVLKSLGDEYRAECFNQGGRRVLVRGSNEVPFYQFVSDRMDAQLKQLYAARRRSGRIPIVENFPI